MVLQNGQDSSVSYLERSYEKNIYIHLESSWVALEVSPLGGVKGAILNYRASSIVWIRSGNL